MKYKIFLNSRAPIVILVRPQLAENMGMVARSMMNCCLSELRLVSPREDHLSKSAVSASSGAQVILERAKVYSSLDEAIADVHYVVATTARLRGINKPVYPTEKASQIVNGKISQGRKVALIFGPERTGLENDDLIMADALLTIPLNPVHSSLNLAQAVLLVGWSWWQENLKKEKSLPQKQELASKKELTLFLNFLVEHLENKNYFVWKDKKERMKQNLKNIFTKSALSSAEIKTLYRVIKRLSGEPKEKN